MFIFPIPLFIFIATDAASSITLSFTKMDTECSYDHVFIYDGESYASPLLGSFSGNTTPPSVTATHGYVCLLLLLLFLILMLI